MSAGGAGGASKQMCAHSPAGRWRPPVPGIARRRAPQRISRARVVPPLGPPLTTPPSASRKLLVMSSRGAARRLLVSTPNCSNHRQGMLQLGAHHHPSGRPRTPLPHVDGLGQSGAAQGHQGSPGGGAGFPPVHRPPGPGSATHLVCRPLAVGHHHWDVGAQQQPAVVLHTAAVGIAAGRNACLASVINQGDPVLVIVHSGNAEVNSGERQFNLHARKSRDDVRDIRLPWLSISRMRHAALLVLDAVASGRRALQCC